VNELGQHSVAASASPKAEGSVCTGCTSHSEIPVAYTPAAHCTAGTLLEGLRKSTQAALTQL